jgi:hypothetical protein
VFVSGPGLARKYWTGLVRLDRDKHSSLLPNSVYYDRNKFYSTGPQVIVGDSVGAGDGGTNRGDGGRDETKQENLEIHFDLGPLS